MPLLQWHCCGSSGNAPASVQKGVLLLCVVPQAGSYASRTSQQRPSRSCLLDRQGDRRSHLEINERRLKPKSVKRWYLKMSELFQEALQKCTSACRNPAENSGQQHYNRSEGEPAPRGNATAPQASGFRLTSVIVFRDYEENCLKEPGFLHSNAY